MKKTTAAKRFTLILALLALTVSGVFAAADGNGNSKIALDLLKSMENQETGLKVIVTFTSGVRASDMLDIAGPSGDRVRVLRGGRFMAGTLDASEIERLANDPAVFSISPDRKVLGSMDTAIASLEAEAWAIQGRALPLLSWIPVCTVPQRWTRTGSWPGSISPVRFPERMTFSVTVPISPERSEDPERTDQCWGSPPVSISSTSRSSMMKARGVSAM
jgi:hypothetical protein